MDSLVNFSNCESDRETTACSFGFSNTRIHLLPCSAIDHPDGCNFLFFLLVSDSEIGGYSFCS